MEKKIRKDKDSVAEFDAQMKDIRQQLSDQLKCLDFRLDNHIAMLSELQDFYRRRSEVEMEYSRGMDKLIKQIMTRHKADKQRQESWPGYSTYTLWQALLGTTRKMGKDHGILGELFGCQMSNRFTELIDDIQRLHKKCKDIVTANHEEFMRVLSELHSAMKTYYVYHSEFLQADSKLRHFQNQKNKMEQLSGGRSNLSKRQRNFEKQLHKKQAKQTESYMKVEKARNEYLLCLEAANAALQKYFIDDVQEIINTMDCGYHDSLSRAVLMHISAEGSIIKSLQGCSDLLNRRVGDLDQRRDKQTFLENFNQVFALPKKFEFQPHKGDEVRELSAPRSLQDDLVDRLNTINERLNTLKVENEEIWKSLETTDKSLMSIISRSDYNVAGLFQEDLQPPKSPQDREKMRSDRMETEEYYLMKFRDYQASNNVIARLQAKYKCIAKALEDNNCSIVHTTRPPNIPPKPKRRRILGKTPVIGRPKLFGGSVDEYIEATNEDIPLVIRSCIRIINLYGMHHQGVFRISGAQHEINEFKNQFEQGRDPLQDMTDGKDINSVAGVLKLYFRELREPLFPTPLFDEFIACVTKYGDTTHCISRIKELVSTLSRPAVTVMRFLFAFLNHLSEFSDENMMDPYNLAICFGPTLLPIPLDHDQVRYQGYVNELIKTIIIHQEEIFPNDGNGTIYEKCLIVSAGEKDDFVDGQSEDDDASGDILSEEEAEGQEVVALYDFQARTERELSFSKGDRLILFERVSADWWEGVVNGIEGLIPDKYVFSKPRLRDDASRQSDMSHNKSTESLPLRTQSLTVNPVDEDISCSHPNVHLVGRSQSHEPVMRSKKESSGEQYEHTSRLSAPLVTSDPDIEKTSDQLSQDIDNALAEMMSGIEMLGRKQHHLDARITSPAVVHAPDLVLDLPVGVQPPSPKTSVEGESPVMTTAEVFASSNQSTIKKGGSATVLRQSSLRGQRNAASRMKDIHEGQSIVTNGKELSRRSIALCGGVYASTMPSPTNRTDVGSKRTLSASRTLQHDTCSSDIRPCEEFVRTMVPHFATSPAERLVLVCDKNIVPDLQMENEEQNIASSEDHTRHSLELSSDEASTCQSSSDNLSESGSRSVVSDVRSVDDDTEFHIAECSSTEQSQPSTDNSAEPSQSNPVEDAVSATPPLGQPQTLSPRTPLTDSESVQTVTKASDTSPVVSKLPPPVKVKPPVMKKPVKSAAIVRQIEEQRAFGQQNEPCTLKNS